MQTLLNRYCYRATRNDKVNSQWGDSNFSSAGSTAEVIYYQPVLFKNGTSISSNANRFAVLIKFPDTVL